MPLADYVRERRAVSVGGGVVVEVSAITPTHLAKLLRTHLADLEAVAGLLVGRSNITMSNATALITSMIGEAPGLAANIIALGANEPDQAEKAMEMPFPVQAQLLTEIFDLTFAEVGGVKKFVSVLLARLNLNPETMRAWTRTLAKKVQSSAGGSEFEETSPSLSNADTPNPGTIPSQ